MSRKGVRIEDYTSKALCLTVLHHLLKGLNLDQAMLLIHELIFQFVSHRRLSFRQVR